MTPPAHLNDHVPPSCDWDGCDGPREHTCANCDRALCDEHGVFSREADEWFCEPNGRPLYFRGHRELMANIECDEICDERHRRWLIAKGTTS